LAAQVTALIEGAISKMLRTPGLQPGDENEVPSFSWAYFLSQPLRTYDKSNIIESMEVKHDSF
jgi:hypothetical protein